MAKKRETDLMQQYIEEIDRFATLLDENQEEIRRLKDECQLAKEAYDRAKGAVREAEEIEHSTVTLLLKFIRPGSHEILPLFDTMDAADDETHGANAGEWRKEPIAVLGLSAAALRALIAADVVLVGQLQDRLLADGIGWHESIDGIGRGLADAIEEKFHDFMNERCKK